jgi:DNA-directed RNA polymerase specialized sigma24 family protein
VRRFMGMLSEDQQEVLLLRYVGGLTAPEPAEILGKNLAAVKGLQHRGERSLARLMGDGSGLAASSRPPGTSQEKWGSA